MRLVGWGLMEEIPKGKVFRADRGIGMGGVVMEVKGAVECSCGGEGMVWSLHATTRTTLS